MEQGKEQTPLLEAAQWELKLLLEEKKQIDQQKREIAQREQGVEARIAAVATTVTTLAVVYGKPEVADQVTVLLEVASEHSPGITEQVRKVLAFRYPHWLPPTVVRHYVEKRNGPIKGDNPMALVHQTLRRLAEQGWADVGEMIDGGKIYRQKGLGLGLESGAGKVEVKPGLVVPPDSKGKLPAQVV